MKLHTLFGHTKLAGRPSRKSRERGNKRAQARLEALESRVLLSTVVTLASFDAISGRNPNSMIMDSSGNLFGTTDFGGVNGAGTAFEIAKGSHNITTLVSFNGLDGTPWPQVWCIDSSGNLYGTTESNGSDSGDDTDGNGTVFEILKPSGTNSTYTLTTLATFDGTNGSWAGGSMAIDSGGNVYGMAGGNVYEVVKGSGSITLLASFDSSDSPTDGVIIDGSGNLYGTTQTGGDSGEGSVWKIAKNSGEITTLASFDSSTGTFTQDENSPLSLVLDSRGNLFGATNAGGDYDEGTAFEVKKDSGEITLLASFDSISPDGPNRNSVRVDSSGNLYVAATGGDSNGAIYKIVKDGTDGYAIIPVASFDGANGWYPVLGGLDSGGNLFGFTYAGGADGVGTVFEVSPSSAATQLVFTVQPSMSIAQSEINPSIVVTVKDKNGNIVSTDNSEVTLNLRSGPGDLSQSWTATAVNGVAVFDGVSLDNAGTYSFWANDSDDGLSNFSSNSFMVLPAETQLPVINTLASFDFNDGWTPNSVVLDADGKLYFASNMGGVYEIVGTDVSSVGSFNTEDGPTYGNLSLVDGDGNLYGVLQSTGNDGYGIVYEIEAGSETVTTLATFDNINGNEPNALIMDSDGNLFGTTLGSDTTKGTVFEIVAGSGTITTLATFNGTNGASPRGGVVLDTDGNLFGTTARGGASNCGTVFEIVKDSGAITTLASFNGTNGMAPHDGVIIDDAGNLFGTTQFGGTGYVSGNPQSGNGTVFEVASGSHAITTLASFAGTNGALPLTGVVLDNDGNLFGATAFGGPGYVNGNPISGGGTVFEIAQGSNAITTLALFGGINGAAPSHVALDIFGNLYGVTSYGGDSGGGTVFQLPLGDIGPAAQLVFGQQPNNAAVGGVINPMTVLVEDAQGYLVAANHSTITLSVADGGPANVLGGTTTVAAVGGIATFSNASVSAAGTYTLNAADSADELSPAMTEPFVASVALAPASLVGKTVIVAGSTSFARLTVTSGTKLGMEDFLHSGTSQLNYTYTVTGPATATLTMVVNSYTVTTQLDFSTGTSGTGFINDPNPDHMNAECAFTIFSSVGNIAPTDISGALVTMDIAEGSWPFDSSGTDTLMLRSNKTFVWSGTEMSNTGTYKYKQSVGSYKGIAQITVTPTDNDTSNYVFLVADSSSTGTFYATDSLQASDPADYMTGTFVLTYPATHLALAQQPLASVVAGQTITAAGTASTGLVVNLLDVHGNIATDDDSEVTIALSGTNGDLEGTTTVQAVNGVATFDDLSLTQVGTFKFTITDSNDSVQGTTSKNVTVVPAAASEMQWVSDASNTTAGAKMSPMSLQLFDEYGNVATNDNSTVTLSVNGPEGGTLTGTLSAKVTKGKGIATFNNVVLTKAGNYTLTATDGSIPDVDSASFTVTPAAAKNMSYNSPLTGTPTAGTEFDPTLSITDAYGNSVLAGNAKVTLAAATAPKGFAFTSRTATASNGEASFDPVTLTLTGTYKFKATAPGFATALCNFTIVPAAADHLDFVQQPKNAVAGVAIKPAITVQVEDEYDNVLTTVTSNITLTINSGPTGYSTAWVSTVAAKKGLATFSAVSLQLAGAYTLQATYGSLDATISSDFTITPAAAKQLSIVQQPPTTATAGTVISPAIQVQILDAFGNLVTSNHSTVVVKIASGPSKAKLSGTTSVAAVNGVATLSALKLATPGTYTLKLTDGSLTPVTTGTLTIA